MRYIGANVHKNNTLFAVLAQEGKVEQRTRIENNLQALREFVGGLPKPAHWVIEAGYHWQPFYEVVEELDLAVSPAQPLKVKLMAEARIKTDTIDAATLAHFLLLNYLPIAYIPPREVRDLLEILRHPARLVKTQTMAKSRIHALLAKNGIRHQFNDLFGKAGRRFVKGLHLRPWYQLALQQLLALLDTLQMLIQEVTEVIEKEAKATPEARLVATIPGVGYYSALLILAEIGDINRFPNGKKLCSWAGLVPSTYSSGGRTYHGHLTKQGSGWLRWILTQAVPHAARGTSQLGAFFQRVARRGGRNAAKMAVARQMLIIIRRMLVRGEPFRDRHHSRPSPYSF